MKKNIFLLISFLLVTTLVNAQFCNKYADKAVTQYKLAKNNNVPNTNWPVWSDDWNGHYNWCKTVPQEAANKQTAFRDTYLNKYLKKSNHTQISDATMAAMKNMAKSQPKFKTIPAIDVSKTADINKDRICENYARESVRQNKENISKNFGLKQPVWSSDYNAHKKWCLHGDNYLKADQILADREKQLKIRSGNTNVVIGRMETGIITNTDVVNKMIENVIITDNNKKTFKLEKGIDRPGNNYTDFLIENSELSINKCIRACESDVKCKSFAIEIDQRKNRIHCYLKNNIPAPVRKVNYISGVKITPNLPEKTKKGHYLTGTTISIPANKLHFKQFIEVKKAGLYKINLTLFIPDKVSDQIVRISPGIDREEYTISLILNKNKNYHKNIKGINNLIGEEPVKGSKSGTNSFKPWIHSIKSILVYNTADAENEFYFFVDQEHVPPGGKLRFDLEITGLEDLTVKKDTGEDFMNSVKTAPVVDLKRHPEITGVYTVDYAPVKNVYFNDNFENGIQYSILKINSKNNSKMQFTVIETPVIRLKNTLGDGKKPVLSFFVANAERLSSEDQDINTDIQVRYNPNKQIYKNILTNEFGDSHNCTSVTLNHHTICSEFKSLKKKNWDLQSPDKRSFLFDIIDPPMGTYAIVTGSENVSLEELLTTGKLLSYKNGPGTKKNEIIVATRYADPFKWVYIAELSKFQVSTQAEYDDNDDDDWLGKFSVLSTSVLTEPLDARNQIDLRPDQVISKSHAFPIVDNVDRPHNFCIRTPGNPGNLHPNNAGAYCYPKIPLFVMDYDQLQNYNSLLLNILSTEHDEASFWDQYGNVITSFTTFAGNFFGSIATTVAGNYGSGLTSLAKAIYTFASKDLDGNNHVDDFMGNAAIILFKSKDFGLNNKNIKSFVIEGPENSSHFSWLSKSQTFAEAECSYNSGKGRSIKAVITLRKVQKIKSRANILLMSFTPAESPFRGDVYFPTSRKELLTEGLLSRKPKTWQDFSFTPVYANEEIIVRKNEPSSFDEKFLMQTKNEPNKSVIMGTEWQNGRIAKKDDSCDDRYSYNDWHKLNRCKNDGLDFKLTYSQDWNEKGFTYYQSEIDDIYIKKARKTAIISFTLYHEDVIENAGKGWVDLRNNMENDTKGEKDNNRTISINSTEIKNNQYPDRKFYKVNIKLYDPGDWLNEVKLIAYVTVD